MKVLKSHTIIPQELYVERDADRQLIDIINDFGRPGYVLVARQMGKTNLLINAKRNLQNENRRFVYVDLSNLFEESRDCFRNIIDTAAETNEEYFEETYEKILERREASNRPAHKEYEHELRALLKSFDGELVIILDEIDALTRASYSDQIFSQIRSIYFTRTNFPEYSRLTYILSGVIEPKEIIKNPKISPFNIGQKILLTDFTFEEFETFLARSKISVDEYTTKRIYYWTAGNPRMTWDICSQIEDEIAKGEKVNISAVNKIVAELYLTNYDRPPIDHIRELVENDREIKNAIIQIRYQKGNTLNDSVRTKLYLAGISNYESKDATIKNKIVDEALNENWISGIEDSSSGLYLMIGAFDAEKYEDCEKYAKQLIETNPDDEHTVSVANYYIGLSCYFRSRYEKALKYLSLVTLDSKQHGYMYRSNEFYKILSNLYQGKTEACKTQLNSFIQEKTLDAFYFQAILQYCHMNINDNTDLNQIEKYLNDLIDEIELNSKNSDKEIITEQRSSVYYQLGRIANIKKEPLENILSYFDRAIDISGPKSKPFLLLKRLMINNDVANTDNEKVINELIDLCIDYEEILHQNESDYRLLFRYNDYRELLPRVLILKKDRFQEFVINTKDKLTKNEIGIVDFIFGIAVYHVQKGSFGLGTPLLENILTYEDFDTTQNLSKLNIYKLLSLSPIGDKESYMHLYEYEFNKDYQNIPNIDHLDFNVLVNILNKKINNNSKNIYPLIEKIKYFYETVSFDDKVNYVMIFNLEGSIYEKVYMIKQARESFSKSIELGEEYKSKSYSKSLLGEKGLTEAINYAKRRINTLSKL